MGLHAPGRITHSSAMALGGCHASGFRLGERSSGGSCRIYPGKGGWAQCSCGCGAMQAPRLTREERLRRRVGPPASALYSGAPWVDSCTVDRPLHLGLMHGGTTPTLQEGTQLSAVPSSSCSAGCGWVAVRLRITHCGLNALQPGCMHLWLTILAARPPQSKHNGVEPHPGRDSLPPEGALPGLSSL